MGAGVRILHLEDDRKDAELIREQIGQADMDYAIALVKDKAQYLAALGEGNYDLILADYKIPSYDGLQALQAARERDAEIPFIFVTGTMGEDIAVESLKSGAVDYVLKDGLSRLMPAIQRALQEVEERKRTRMMEKQLMDSVIHWQTTFDAINDGIFLADAEGTIVRCNRAFADFTGEKMDRIVGRRCHEVVHGSAEFLAQCPFLLSKQSLHRENIELEDSGRWMSVTVDPVLGTNGEIVSFIHIISDITNRKHDEERLRYVTRLYATLSQINQTIVRVSDPQELYEEICRIAIDFGRFRLSWIGLLDPETGGMTSAAKSGMDDGFIGLLTAGKGEKGSGWELCDLDIRKGELIICDDIAKESHAFPLADEALRRGFRSFAAVPFQLRDRVIGCLNLYAAETGFFTQDEKLLLEEIGMDISFALDRIETGRARQEAEDALHRIEWQLRPRAVRSPVYEPSYGDPARLNTDRTILGALGRDTLLDIVNDFMDMLGTSSAVYEKNGDYAIGIFSSGWCQFLDMASYNLCNAGLKEALASGKWSCHESCWTEASKASIESGRPVERECAGRLRLYAVPIKAGDEIIGSINFGYGDPPRDPAVLSELAAGFGVGVDELKRRAEGYESRPPFIIDIAKNRLSVAANLIGLIVERKQTEQKLREERDRFARIVATAPGAICSFRLCTDGSACFPYASPSIQDVYGLLPEDLAKDASIIDDLIHPDDLGRVRESIMESARSLSPWRDEFRFRHPAKGEVWIETHFAPMREEDGCTTWQGIITDITGQRRLEEQFNQAQKMEAVGTLAGGVAHDFNNILSAMIGYAHLASTNTQPDSLVRNYLDQILESAHRATTLTQSLLAFSRKQPMNMELLNLNDLVERFEKFLLRLLREDIELKTAFDEHELPVMADRTQVEQILMNLATNARDAMPGGGSLLIETRLQRIDHDFSDLHGYGKAGEYAVMTVSDTGTGMDEETKARIFEPFFTTKEQGKGTGLGLSTVYGVVKKHEGFITVYSEPGRGTTFRIYLPVQRSSVQIEDSGKVEEPPITGGSETILIAEDDDTLRALTKAILEHYGYAIIEAVDGEDAIQKFIANKNSIQLVLLDGIMPKKNGREVYNEIRVLNEQIKTIFMSGYSEDIFTRNGLPRSETTCFMVKPLAPAGLLRKVRELLDT